MFDIGFWELLVIGIIALLVIGPERLPSFIRSCADTIKSIKGVANGFKEEMSQQLKAHELHENLKKAEQMGLDNIGGDIKKSVDELRAAAASVQKPYESTSGGTIDPTNSKAQSENDNQTNANQDKRAQVENADVNKQHAETDDKAHDASVKD